MGNARLHCERLTIKEQEQIIEALEDIYPNGISATELNDIFAFECDFIAETLRYKGSGTVGADVTLIMFDNHTGIIEDDVVKGVK